MKATISILAAAGLAVVSIPAIASTGGADLNPLTLSQPDQSMIVLKLARHGADDPANHDVRDDKGGKRHARGGKGRGGHDDGPNHA
jgi:hypothetical protein